MEVPFPPDSTSQSAENDPQDPPQHREPGSGTLLLNYLHNPQWPRSVGLGQKRAGIAPGDTHGRQLRR